MKVLITDDDLTTRLTLGLYLKKWGYQVMEAASGPEAWECLNRPEAPSLAIVDWVMPGLSGPQLCRQIKASASVIKPYIILLTARGERRDIVQGLDSGADDFMTKPYHPDELRARVSVGERVIGLQGQLFDMNRQLEDRVRERTREVERLLRHKEELLQHLSHDLKTPLTPLVSLLPELLRQEADPDRRQMLELMLDGAHNIRSMITRVLELCQAGSAPLRLNPGGEDLRTLASSALEAFRHAIPVGSRDLSNEVPAGLRVRADVASIRQALKHLFDNAVKFTPDRGRIVVRAETGPDAVTVAVQDDGLGLEPHELPLIFEPFHKVDPSRHHLGAPGLGLSIVKTIVEQHGGRAWATSPGLRCGSVFYFTLPSESS